MSSPIAVTRVAICGAPRTGKTSHGTRISQETGVRLRSTDSIMDLGWSESSLEVARWLDSEGPLLIEGVAVMRALRKWMKKNASGKPIDKLVLLTNPPFAAHSSGQASMAKGIETVTDEILGDLVARGVRVQFLDVTREQ